MLGNLGEVPTALFVLRVWWLQQRGITDTKIQQRRSTSGSWGIKREEGFFGAVDG